MIKNSYLRELVNKATKLNKTIVLPEGEDLRVLEAAHIVNKNKAAKLIILGDVNQITADFAKNGWNLDGIELIDPKLSSKKEAYANLFYELRKDKGVTLEAAQEMVLDTNYFGVLMVKAGDADGMVSGANHSTADTVRPALQIIKSKEKGKSVSSAFVIITSSGEEFVFSDCAIIPNPGAQELADIAIQSAKTAQQFGIKPSVAMLSYSTLGSGMGEGVDKVRNAVALAKKEIAEKGLGFALDGEMQADAALDAVVAKKKAPNSLVAGKANILIFPDLASGNIGYKLLQRLGACQAYGPMLQGLNAPINDLSRGASVEDIVGTIAITAIQV